MNSSFIIYFIVGLFFLILILRNFIPKRIKDKTCSVCLAFALTWIGLWIARFYFGIFIDSSLLGILMGMTILGIFYALERKIKKELTLFRLPFLLTLVFIAYYSLSFTKLKTEFIFIGILWIIFLVIYFFKENKKLNGFFNKIVECCKKW